LQREALVQPKRACDSLSRLAGLRASARRALIAPSAKAAGGLRPQARNKEETNMTRKNRKHEETPVVETVEPVAPTPEEEAVEQAAEAEIEAQIALPRSVVKPAYKVKYRDRAREAGIKGKAAKRSAWDWLAQELAAATLTKDAKLKVDDFLALLDANGVDHSRWTNRSKGWEGRLRMTGRLALQRVVAERGTLLFADGEIKDAPAEWVAKFLS
jgi:hypothetical protein